MMVDPRWTRLMFLIHFYGITVSEFLELEREPDFDIMFDIMYDVVKRGNT